MVRLRGIDDGCAWNAPEVAVVADFRTPTSRHLPSKIIGLLAICCLLVAGACPADEKQKKRKHGEFASETLTVDGTKRVFRLVVPKTVDLKKPAPLIVAFHGILIDSKDLMPRYTQLNETAEKHGYVVVYPNALDRSWGIKPQKIREDLEFLDALLEHVADRYQIDDRRIYLLGMSNGGYFAHLAGQARSTRVAAVASHSGPLGLQTLLGVRSERKFPVMIIHGDRDPIFPASFARENRDKYTREGHFVEYHEIAGLGHAWASDHDINEKILTFFEANPLED